VGACLIGLRTSLSLLRIKNTRALSDAIYCANRGYGNIRQISPPAGRGSASQYVRERFPEQVKACRGSLGRRASCLLIVLTDADNLTVAERERTLQDELIEADQAAVEQSEPIVVLIPKWQVETWIKCLLGQIVSEDDSETDNPSVTADDIKGAAQTLFNWARPSAQPGATCVASLTAALPRWRRIG